MAELVLTVTFDLVLVGLITASDHIRTASEDIGPHRSLIVPHRSTDVTKQSEKTNYSTQNIVALVPLLIKNGQFVIMTEYVIC